MAPKLTKEEKKLEKELKKIAKEKKQTIDHLNREKAFCQISDQRGSQAWKSWLEKITVDELRNEVSAVHQSVDQMLDRSDYIIEDIQNQRLHAEEHYLMSFHSHTKLIDYIMGNVIK